MKRQFMKKLLGSLLAGVMAVSMLPIGAAQAASDAKTYIPNSSTGIYNANLYRYAIRKFDSNHDGKLSVAEAKAVTEIHIGGHSDGNVTSLKGIYWFSNLETLILQDCGISSVHADIGKLTKLTTLEITGNKVSALPGAVGNLKNLTSVNLRNNKFTALPTVTKNWTKLTSLDLSGNNLTQIPVGSIPYMTSLTTLNLANNKLVSNTSSTLAKLNKLSTLTKLTTLNLSGNSITALPTTALGKMTKLKYLYLQNNAITEIPSVIGKLTALVELDASNNKITKIDASISKCVKINKLKLQNNKLTTIPSLKALTKLKCTSTDYYALNLCGNKLSKTTIRNNTNTVLTTAWVNRQKTTTFVPIEKINAVPAITDMFLIGFTRTYDLTKFYSFNPSNATYKTVKYVVETTAGGVSASINGNTLTVNAADASEGAYVFVRVYALDGSGAEDLIYFPGLSINIPGLN